MSYLYRLFCFFKRKRIKKVISKGGGEIGVHTVISAPYKCFIDTSRPWLLSIGDYCVISQGSIILTHDYSLSTLRRVYGEWIGEGKETVLGDNCFIGMNSILLMGTRLGNNVIVGAGSVVHGIFGDNVVIAGNPARVICSLDEHYEKRKKKSVEEAIECVNIFERKLKRKPSPKDLPGFKFLFCPRDKSIVERYGLSFNCSADEPREVAEAFYNSKPYWSNFEDFLSEAENSRDIVNDRKHEND